MTAFADKVLADRIERLVVTETRAFGESTARLYPEVRPAWIEVAGGLAVYVGPDSPLNGAWALGTSREVSGADVDDIECFFSERGERPVASMSPFADPSLMCVLGERGWTPRCFENVLVRELLGEEEFLAPEPPVEIRIARTADERELWATCVANGFSAPDDPAPAEVRLSRAAAANEHSTLLLAFVEGQPAGTGELSIGDGIGVLSADTTLPQYRRRGVQRSLQRARLVLAREAGCELAVSESVPGSASQRNMERLGFRLAYVRVECAAPAIARESA